MKFKDQIIQVPIGDKLYSVMLCQSEYTNNGRLAIQGIDGDEGPFAMLTVNLPQEELGKEEVFIKTWDVNETFAAAARKTGFFEDTGRRVRTGWCEAEVWKIL